HSGGQQPFWQSRTPGSNYRNLPQPLARPKTSSIRFHMIRGPSYKSDIVTFSQVLTKLSEVLTRGLKVRPKGTIEKEQAHNSVCPCSKACLTMSNTIRPRSIAARRRKMVPLSTRAPGPYCIALPNATYLVPSGRRFGSRKRQQSITTIEF